ncbi:MAG: PAS domain-containing protein [Phycisphaera sp.]|nr:MAG: PAS domain-containing protein [Phycisphaera sp.]
MQTAEAKPDTRRRWIVRVLVRSALGLVLAFVFAVLLIDHLSNLHGLMLAAEICFVIAVAWPLVQALRRLKSEASTQRQDLEWLADIARRTTNAVIVTDVQRRVIWVNDAFTRISGYTLDEMIGRVPGQVLFSPNSDPSTLDDMFEQLSNDRGFQGELLNRAKDGSDYWVLLDMQPRHNDDGALIGFMAIESDITERKLTQIEQERVMAELAGFFESSLELLCIIDFQGRYVKANDAWENLLGISCDELCSREFREFVHPDDISTSESRLETLSQGGSIAPFRNRYRSRDGSWRTLEWRANRRGGFVYAAARDVTEQIEMERALLEQAERTEMALAGGDLGTWDWEIKTGRLSLDARWAEMIGETIETVGNTTDAWSSRVHPEDLPNCQSRLWEYVNNGMPYQDVRFRMRHRDGNWRWIRASGKVVAWDEHDEPIRMVGTHSDVTDVVLGEALQNETNHRMELALEAGGMGFWDWDLDTGEFACDERWAALLGEQSCDLIPDASTLLTRVHPEDLELLESQIQRHVEGQQPFIGVQCRMRHKDGTWRWTRVFGKSTADSISQAGSRLVGIQMDVHEQVESQTQLARRETELANTVRLAGVGGWDLDHLRGVLVWSDQVKAIHEVGADFEPSLESAIQFYAPDVREQVGRYVERAIQFGEAFDFEMPFTTAKGRHRWVRSVGEPVYVEGKIVRVAGAFQDITDQRAQREALEESNQALEVAQTISRMGSWSYDAATREATWSKHLFYLFDLPSDTGAPTNEQVLAQYVEEDSARLAQAIEIALTEGTPYALTLQRRHDRNGVRFVTVEGRVRRDENGNIGGLFGTARDVTAEVEREAELREARLRAEDASRSKTEFLANMSHEIRTPMTAILGYADLLDDANLTGEQRSEHVEVIKRNGEHLLTIINDILDVSKIDAGRMVVERLQTAPHEVLRDVARLMRVKADAKGLDLVLDSRTDVPKAVLTDPTRLRQILVNLLGNAIKFTARGTVSVSMGYEHGPEGGRLSFRVCDTGIGMTSEQLEHVFTAFTQADASMTRRFGGTGLGLRISKRLANMLGGDISVESIPGEGSAFTLTIEAGQVIGAESVPASSLSLSPIRKAREAATSRNGGEPLAGLRILLMEDGLDNLRLICTHLRRAGADVTTAADGRLGLSLLTDDGTVDGPLHAAMPFDAIVTDMQMPNLDGYTVVKMLRERGCQLPIVALTAHSMPGDEERCLEAGCDAYAAKPVNKHELIEALLGARQQRPAA